MISHRDFKQIKKNMGCDVITSNAPSLNELDIVFKNIEDRQYSKVDQFYSSLSEAIKKITDSVNNITEIDISYGVVPDVSGLLPMFEKVRSAGCYNAY